MEHKKIGRVTDEVKEIFNIVLVAIKLHKSGDFFYVPTMYRLQDFKLQSRIKSGRLRKLDQKSR